ncbi:MAG: Sensor protein FixL [Pseudomonadota bacterium]|jgi:PAS domain S-box-containing protein
MNEQDSVNECAKYETNSKNQDDLTDTTINSLTQMANELEALKIKNSLLEDAYQQLDNHHVVLKEQNNVLIDELSLAKIDMNSAVGGKNKFLNIISHELMTPLTAIMGFAELLSYADMPKKQKNQVVHIINASRQLHEMLTELLTHIQLNSGEITVENKPFVPLSLLTNVSERIYKNALAKGLSVSAKIDPALSILVGDKPLLKHVLDILASNAVKFTQQGSISLAAQLLDKKEDKVHVAFAVKDSGDGVWDWNVQTHQAVYSRLWKEMLGYTEDEILPTNQEWLDLIHPDDQLPVAEVLQVYLDGKTEIYVVEYRLRCKDGSYKWILSRGLVVDYTEEGRPLRMIGTHTDISKRKCQEQQDKAHLNQLAHLTRLGLMGEMASGIAHEVNQPLTAIATYTQASLNLMKAECPDLVKIAEIVYKTQQQALRTGQIIRRMQEFVKSNTRQVLATNLNELIQDASGLCLPDLKQSNITLTLQLQDSLPLINVDRIQIEQVIISLIRNSADALGSGFENQQKEISIDSLLTLNEGIEVRVKDNGRGITEDQQQHILMPFYTTKTDGMGMGLSICRSIIEAHQGYLKFNSKAGKGTTFYFTLPIKTDTL